MKSKIPILIEEMHELLDSIHLTENCSVCRRNLEKLRVIVNKEFKKAGWS